MPLQIIPPKLDSIRNYLSNGASKKSFLYLVIVILAFIIIAVGLIWYFSQKPEIEEVSIPEKSEEEKMIEQQLEELEKLRTETAPLSEREIQTQLEELEELRQKQKPPSQQEIQKQLEELDKLRKQ